MAIKEVKWEPLEKNWNKGEIYGKQLFFKLIIQDEFGNPINKFTWKNQEDYNKVLELLRLKYGLKY